MRLYICTLLERPSGEPPRPLIHEGQIVTREIVAESPGKARHEWLCTLHDAGWDEFSYANISVRTAKRARPAPLFGADKRLECANDIIRVIATHGRRFFSSDADWAEPHADPFIAHFYRDDRNELWFVDSYTRKSILVRHFEWPGFTNGGTMRAIVEHLADHIETGKPINLSYFSPSPQWVNGGDLWGYGNDMALVAKTVASLVKASTMSEDAA